MSLTDFVRDWHDAVWNRLDEAHIRAHMADDCVNLGLPDTVSSPEEVIAYVRTMSAMLSGIRVETLEAVASGDEVMTTCRFRATHRRTCDAIDLTYAVYMRVEDGRVRASRSVVPFDAILAAARRVEPDAIAKELASVADRADDDPGGSGGSA